MTINEFKQYLTDKNLEATKLLSGMTSEADRLKYLDDHIINMDGYEHFLKAAKSIADDAQGDIDHLNQLSDEVFNHPNRDEFYGDCYMEFMTINFALKSCAYQAARIEETAKHIVNKYGVLFQYGQGMEFGKIIVSIPDFDDVINFITECDEKKKDQIVTPEDVKLMIEKDTEDLDISDAEVLLDEPDYVDESDIPDHDSKFAGKNIRFAEDDGSTDDDDYDHVIGVIDGPEDLPKRPYTNDIHQVYASFDEKTKIVTSWYYDQLVHQWLSEPWNEPLTETTFEDYVQSVETERKFTPNGLKIFSFAYEVNDLPLHNKYKGTVWAVRNGTDAEFNPMFIYYAWDEAEDGTPYYCGFTGDDNIWGGTPICTISWNGFQWVDSMLYNFGTCQFISVAKSYNELNTLDDCYDEVSNAIKANKTPIKVLYLDHEDGNSTIEPYAYKDDSKKWIRAIPIKYPDDKKSTMECTEEFVHDWKNHAE